MRRFDTKEDFFSWLENYYFIDSKKKYNENSSEKDIIISNDEKESVVIPNSTKKDLAELDFIEKALLDELEYKLLNELGDGN